MKEQSELDTTKNDSVNANETEILEVSHEAYCKKKPLVIFKTDADIYGRNISAMSNFFDGYVQEMSLSIRESDGSQVVMDLPISDLSIIGESINQAEIVMRGNVTLLPDFDILPSDVRSKLKKGLYSVGESKQVDGNMRAVILDENGVRVKDITLKKVLNSPANIETMRSIGNQLQMRQIYAKLSDIEEFQTYQIERDRDRDIIVPFLDARSLVLEAATKDSETERAQMLKEADSKIRTALNSVYRDIETTSNSFAKRVNIPFLGFGKQINTYMSYIADDLQIATKYVGVRMQILEYLGESKTEKTVLQQFNHTMLDFIEQPITRKGLSAATLMQDYFPYNEENMDCWYKFSKDLKPAIESSMKQLELETKDYNNQEIYVVSVEDESDE